MKRCPQCQFIYPDTDEFCDFDNTQLAVITDAEIDAATQPINRPALAELAVAHSNAIANWKARRKLPIAAGVGLVLGIVAFAVYYGISNRVAPAPATMQSQTTSSRPASLRQVPSPSPVPSPTPVATPTPARPEAVATRISSAHSTLSTGPVSTTGETVAKAKPVIILAGGGKLEADEVWRTKDGVWYRRNGVVTLLKKNKVKAIVNQ
jgi:hypothetical protein